MQKPKPHSYSTKPKWLVILVASLIILSLSCSLFGNGDSQNADSLKQTEVALGVQQTLIAAERELTAEPQVEATSSSELTPSPEFTPTTEVLASDTPPATSSTEVDETEEGTIVINRQASLPGEIYYSEAFDLMEGWYAYPLHGDVNGWGYEMFDNRLRTEIVSEDTWVYFMFEGAGDFEDTRTDITVENRASNTNYVGMICRHSDKGWYEANVLNTGQYAIYYSSQDGFDIMHKGASTLINLGRTINRYALICNDEVLTLIINGFEEISIPLKTGDFRFLDEGQVGLSVSTSFAIPVKVDFLEFELSVP